MVPGFSTFFQETLAYAEEIAPFSQHSSQMDYIVSVESNVFVPSFSGNMACAVDGDRQFLGHHKTTSPDRYRGAACKTPLL